MDNTNATTTTTNNNGFDNEEEVRPPQEMKLSVMEGGLRLAGQLWTPTGASSSYGDIIKNEDENGGQCKRIITYPGWLDNAGSFANLAKLLVKYGYFVLCLDPPGTGHSDHRPLESTYSDYNEAPLIIMAADDIGWNKFILIGHSRGGGVGALTTGAFPERIIAFISFDAAFGVIGTWFRDIETGIPTAPQRMRLAYKQVKKNKERKMRIFKTLEEAIDANANNPIFIKSRSTATNIVLRHIKPCNGGFTFTHDIRTYGTQAFVSTREETLRQFLSDIKCPVLSIVMKDGINSINPSNGELLKKSVIIHKERIALIKDFTYHEVVGGHHLHSDEAQTCLDIILPFLNQPKLIQKQSLSSSSSSSSSEGKVVTASRL